MSMSVLPESSLSMAPDDSKEPIPFPSNAAESSTAALPGTPESSKAASNLTSSDKLSALPPSPNPNRIFRSYRRSLDASTSSADFSHDSPKLTGFGSPKATSASDGGSYTPKRVSFDSDRLSLPTMQSVRQALSRHTPVASDHPDSPHSRATSPLRLLMRLRSHDPFIPVDPFHFRLPRLRIPWLCSRQTGLNISSPLQQPTETLPGNNFSFINTFFRFDAVLQVIYLHLLLRLPALYFTRVAKIFQDAEVSKPDIQRMIDAAIQQQSGATTGPFAEMGLPLPEDWTPDLVSPALVRFKHSWEAFIDSLLREWKTLNVVSALLLSAILTMFQIPSSTDPLTRTIALLSLVCALMSLSYGCVYIVRFGTMRSMYRASRWAEEARKTNTSLWWNVWVLLAMPAVWLSWSMLFFIASILSFVWRPDIPKDSPPLSLISRILITALMSIGIIYFGMIVSTLKSYGNQVEIGPMGYRSNANGLTEERGRQRGRERERSFGRSRAQMDIGIRSSEDRGGKTTGGLGLTLEKETV
ncbi:hypothetical protein C8J56DRAFT_868211 [Mycena floridula]|nr:hypothetical protein C8J56DRAFT_868211 [Mycena floridula]